jgi:hypothetical protein
MEEYKNFRVSAKILIILLSIVVLSANAAVADLYPMKPIKNRPEGWNGIAWEDPPKSLGKARKFLGEISEFGAQYTTENELLSFGNAKIREIKYYFNDNKLVIIEFTFKRTERKEILRRAVEKFGPPQFNGINDDIFAWFDDVICVYLNFESHRKCCGFMRYMLRSSSNTTNFPAFSLKPIPSKNILLDFLGMKFGDTLESSREKLIFVRDNQEQGIEIYRKEEEIISWENLKVKNVHYWFYRSKLFFVNIIFDETTKRERIEEYLILKFGMPVSISQDEQIFQWYDGNEFAISMIFNINGDGGELL